MRPWEGTAFPTTEGAAAAAELSAGARLAVGATRAVTTAGLDAGAQVLIQGGDLSDQFLENLLIHGGSAIFERLGKELSLAKEVEKRSAGLWGKVGGAGKAVLKEGVAIGLHTVSGVALSYVAHVIVTRKVSTQSIELRDWFLQGAAIAIGRHTHDLISSKRPLHQKLVSIPELPAGELDRLDAELLKLSQRAQEAPKPEDPFDILERRAQVLDREIALFDKLESDPALLERAKLSSPELAHLALASRTERADVGHANLEDLAIAASGLKELVPDRVYSGTCEQIKDLLAHAKRIGLGVESSQEFDHSWDIDLGTKKIQVRVAEGGKPVVASELEVHEQPKEPAETTEAPSKQTHAGFGNDPHVPAADRWKHLRDVAHAAGADPANTQRLVNILDAIGVTPELASTWGSLERLAQKSVCDAIGPILPLIERGRIKGIEDWLEFGAKKDEETLTDMTAELREAARRANEDPSVTVLVGQDGVAKKQAEKNNTLQPPSFDMTVVGQDGGQEHVETKAIAHDVQSGADLMSGVAHAAAKAHDSAAAGSPVTGTKSATIEVTVAEVIDQTKRKKGMITIDKNTGRRVRLTNEDPPRQIEMTNLYVELAELLNKTPRMDILDGVTIIDTQSGMVLAKLARQGVWKRVN